MLTSLPFFSKLKEKRKQGDRCILACLRSIFEGCLSSPLFCRPLRQARVQRWAGGDCLCSRGSPPPRYPGPGSAPGGRGRLRDGAVRRGQLGTSGDSPAELLLGGPPCAPPLCSAADPVRVRLQAPTGRHLGPGSPNLTGGLLFGFVLSSP